MILESIYVFHLPRARLKVDITMREVDPRFGNIQKKIKNNQQEQSAHTTWRWPIISR